MEASREIVRFDDLSPYLFLQNGNFLYKVPFRGGWAMLKVYYGSRGWWGCVRKSFGNVVLHGQTSYMPLTRCRVEGECMRLWRAHGFRVFDMYDEVEVVAPGCHPGGHRLMEFREAPKLIRYLCDESLPADERFGLYRRFLVDWGRRHEIAIAERDPRLVHENGDGKHVMLVDGGFLWFDFEMAYRSSSRIEDYVSHEIVQYVWHTMRTLPESRRDRFLEETIAGYPSRERLDRAYRYLFRHPNLLHRVARSIHRLLRPGARKATSKYNAIVRLYEKLERR
ncbi:MAG: hypothetical protein A2Z34_04875 [Planctomycetes bacterium RBG_16_59_8]|nr:MAG: hypothetical protein A2Z34_04875 [Planctomycetes bacterium RBG_16_59_8]